MRLTRRRFSQGLSATVAAGLLTPSPPLASGAMADYFGPNVIIVRFGGGVRRKETIDTEATYAPFLRHTFSRRGTLIPDMTIAQLDGVATSHAEGTLNILTGRYRAYRDAGSRLFSQRLEPTQATLFEYFRETFELPTHQALLVNGEDRPQEEFFTYGMHRHYGVEYRSEMLSLHRFKLFQVQQILAQDDLADEERAAAQQEYDELAGLDYRGSGHEPSPEIGAFWRRWREYYGDSGLVNPRGDRLLTELAVRALGELRPRLMMINYQDTDYVHWGNASHYTRAISIIDQGLARLVSAVDADEAYRDNTLFVVVPDCGRDANPLLNVPFQHHFNTKSAHEIWAFVAGPGIAADRVLDKRVDQTSIAATVGAVMGFDASGAEGDPLEEIML